MALATALAVLLALIALSAHAATGVLVVVRAAAGIDVTPYELRLRSELQTEGLDAVVVNATAVNQDTKALAGRFGASDVIEVTVTGDDVGAWVWVTDPSVSLEVARNLRVRLPQRDAVTVFALRTVDLLMGAKLELEQQRRAKQSGNTGTPSESASNGKAPLPNGAESKAIVTTDQPKKAAMAQPAGSSEPGARGSAPAAVPASHAAPGMQSRLRLGAGVAMMQFTDRLARRIAPSISASYWITDRLGIGLTATGPFMATILMSSTGLGGENETNRVSIDQEFSWLDARYVWSLSQQLDLEPSLGLGVARYGAAGSGGSAYLGRQAHAFSLISTLGTTLSWRVAPKVRLMVDAACVVRFQTPLVVVEERDETGTSRLNFWGSFGPAWVF
jgi:hypothetical protein